MTISDKVKQRQLDAVLPSGSFDVGTLMFDMWLRLELYVPGGNGKRSAVVAGTMTYHTYPTGVRDKDNNSTIRENCC